MTSNKGPQSLVTPQPRPVPDSATINPNPKKLEEWIQALPRAHVGETGRLVFNALSQLNKLDISPEMRFAALEQLIAPINYVVNASQKHFIGHAFPLSPKAAKVVALAQTMYTEIGLGYKIIVEALLAKSTSVAKNRGFVASVFRTLSYLNMAMHYCYITYQPSPRGFWLEFHKIYHFSATAGIQDLKQNDLGLPNDSIEDQYKQALLMALVNTYQLSQEDISAIHESLGSWTPYCDLSVLEDAKRPNGIVIINLDSDEPPTYAAFMKDAVGPCLALNTDRLGQRLSILMAAEASLGEAQPSMSKELLQRMHGSWCSVPKRSFRRRQTGTTAKVILGLSAVHSFLTNQHCRTQTNQQQANDRSLLFRASFSGQSVTSHSDSASNAYPDLLDFYDGGSSIVAVGADGSFNRTSSYNLNKNGHEQTYEHEFVITNESAGGYCLSGTPSQSGAIKVGEILYMKQTGQDGTYNLCVVRWMRRDRDRLVLGVEILTPHADPVLILAASRDTSVHPPLAALLFPATPIMNLPATLISAATLRPGQSVRIKLSTAERDICIEKVIQSTRTFRQYQFTEPNNRPVNEIEANFDSIWSSL